MPRKPPKPVDEADTEACKQLLYEARLTRAAAAKQLGIHAISMHRYASGAERVPLVVLHALRALARDAA